MNYDEIRQSGQRLLQESAELSRQSADKQAAASEVFAQLAGCTQAHVNPTKPPPIITEPNVTRIGSDREFREALESEGERVVRVDNGLDISVGSTIEVKHAGLTLLPSSFRLSAERDFDSQMIQLRAPAVLQGIRQAHGQGTHVDAGGDACCGDLISLYPGAQGSVIRHCTLTEGVDETLDGWGDGIDDVTVEDSIIGFGIEPHSMGVLVGGGSNKSWIFRRNLMAYSNNRNPMLHVDKVHVYNNFIYRNKARGIQAFGRYERQEQSYYDNFVWHKDGVDGSWGSANAGEFDGGTLVLRADGNMNNTTRKSINDDERLFWSADAARNGKALPYTGDIRPVERMSDSVSADQVWDLLREKVGAPLRDDLIVNLIDEIDQQVAA